MNQLITWLNDDPLITWLIDETINNMAE